MKSPLTTPQLTHPCHLCIASCVSYRDIFSVFTSYNKKAKVESDSPPPRFFTKGNIKSEVFCTFFFFHLTKWLADISSALSDSFLELHKVSLARHLLFTPQVLW